MSTNETAVNNTQLSDKELEHFKEQLLVEKQKAEERINDLEDSVSEIEQKMDDTTSGRAHHQGDLGSEEEIRKTNYTLIEKQKDKLEKITAALDRIGTGNYGICLVTGKPIPKERLEIMPWATHSVAAKEGTIGPDRKEQLSVDATD